MERLVLESKVQVFCLGHLDYTLEIEIINIIILLLLEYGNPPIWGLSLCSML